MSDGILSKYFDRRKSEKEPPKYDPIDDIGFCGYVSGKVIRWRHPEDSETKG